jgi:hypothetical protein
MGKNKEKVLKFIDQLPLTILIVAAVTLGLAPFSPQPHVIEKLAMLFSGTLAKPVDIFDLLLHGAPWVLLAIKLMRLAVIQLKGTE